MAEEHRHVYILESEFSELRRKLDELERKFAAVEGASKKLDKAADSNKKKQQELGQAVEGVGKIVKAFEGQIGGAYSVVEDFAEGLGKASGVLGTAGTAFGATALAAAALTFGVVGLTSKVISMARAAADADPAIVKLFDEGHQQRASELKESFEGLDAATAALSVQLTTATDDIGDLVDGLTGAVAVVGELHRELGRVSEDNGFFAALAGFGRMVDQINPVSVALTEVADAGVAVKNRFREAQESAEDFGATFPVRVVEDLRDKIREAKEAAREAEREMAAWRSATDSLQDVIDSMNSDQLDDLQKIRIKYQDLREEVAGLAGDESLRADAVAAINEREERELAAARERRATAEADLQERLREQWTQYYADLNATATEASDAADALAQQMAEDYAAWMQEAVTTLRDGLIGAVGDAGSAIGQIARLEAEQLRKQKRGLQEIARQEGDENEARREWAKQQIEGINEQLEQRRKAMVAGFRMEQAAALSGVAVQAAEASLALLTALAPLGPGAPLAVAAIVGPMVAASTAKILAQKPPKLHDGGMGPDEFSFAGSTVRNGESYAVFNQRATETGLAQEVDAANRGMRSGPVRLVLEDAGRVIGEALLVAAEGPGSVGRQLRAAGLTPKGI